MTKANIMNASSAGEKTNWIYSEKIHATDDGR